MDATTIIATIKELGFPISIATMLLLFFIIFLKKFLAIFENIMKDMRKSEEDSKKYNAAIMEQLADERAENEKRIAEIESRHKEDYKVMADNMIKSQSSNNESMKLVCSLLDQTVNRVNTIDVRTSKMEADVTGIKKDVDYLKKNDIL